MKFEEEKIENDENSENDVVPEVVETNLNSEEPNE